MSAHQNTRHCICITISHACMSIAGVEHVAGDMYESVPSGDACLIQVCLNASNYPVTSLC